MSKNLKKASDWIQRQIDELNQQRDNLLQEAQSKEKEAQEIGQQVKELNELLDKIPSNGDLGRKTTLMTLDEAIKIIEEFNSKIMDGSWLSLSSEEIEKYELAMKVLDNQ